METLTFKNLLVPFDFEQSYLEALKAAKELSDWSGAKLIILNCMEPITVNNGMMGAYFYSPFETTDTFLQDRKEAIQPYLQKLRLSEDMYELRVKTGTFHSVIRKICATEKIDLIVAPDFHRSAVERLLSAINPLALMRSIKTPVLAINSSASQFSLTKIVLPIRNVSNWFDKVPFTAAIAKLTGAQLFVIGLTEKSLTKKRIKNDERVWLCERYLDRLKVNYQTEHFYKNGNTFNELIFFSELNQVDLISVSPPPRIHSFQSLFSLNLYNKLVTQTTIPVIGFTLS